MYEDENPLLVKDNIPEETVFPSFIRDVEEVVLVEPFELYTPVSTREDDCQRFSSRMVTEIARQTSERINQRIPAANRDGKFIVMRDR